MEQLQPQMWDKLYPRHYPDPPACGDYCPAKDPAHFFLWRFHRADQTVGMAEQPLMAMATSLMDCGTPMMWPSPSIIEAIQHRRPPPNLDGTTTAIQHASMVMMLPRGTIIHPTEGDVRFIAFSRIGYIDPMAIGERVFSYVAYTRQYPALVELTAPIVPLTTIADRGPAKGRAVQPAVCHLLFGALFLMVTQPSLVTMSRGLSTIPEWPERWSRRVRGADFKDRAKTLNNWPTNGRNR
jgi:hypothetical protein